ncbi:MAG TPA: hypothetical protein VH475_26015 [Tepidisphaeraceae bacterium]|jgi:hypothetical protein
MMRATYRILVLAILVAAGSVGYWYYHNPFSPAVQIQRLEAEKRQLQDIVQRLTDERRVAEMIVTDQKRTADGLGVETTLLFVEQARDGSPLPAKSFTVKGDEVWVAGLSIRFEQGFVEKGDALRGRGIMLFTKIFGQDQTPAQGLAIDEPGKIPDVYRGDPAKVARVTEFERELWQNFWRLVDDKAYRAEKGVATAGGKAVYFKAMPERLYHVTLDVSGNPTVDWEPVKPIYREAMKKGVAQGTARDVQ